MAVGGNVTVRELIQEMADPARQHHREQRGDHGKDDQSRGDADNLLPDGFPKHLSRPASPHLASKAKGHPSSRRTSNRVRAHTAQLALRAKSDFPNPFSASRKKGNPRRVLRT